jgi:6-pyruvoyltetrahydropterin/6-carboxytetrahydropterin synthase
VKAYFGRRYALSASHRLHTDALTPEANREAFGKCNNPHGHGHNYIVEVLVGGPVDAETGMVVNLAELDRVARERIVERFDHSSLNEDELFQSTVPTTENLCRALFALVKNALPAGKLEHIRVEETENNYFEYHGD